METLNQLLRDGTLSSQARATIELSALLDSLIGEIMRYESGSFSAPSRGVTITEATQILTGLIKEGLVVGKSVEGTILGVLLDRVRYGDKEDSSEADAGAAEAEASFTERQLETNRRYRLHNHVEDSNVSE